MLWPSHSRDPNLGTCYKGRKGERLRFLGHRHERALESQPQQLSPRGPRVDKTGL